MQLTNAQKQEVAMLTGLLVKTYGKDKNGKVRLVEEEIQVRHNKYRTVMRPMFLYHYREIAIRMVTAPNYQYRTGLDQ